MEIFPDVPSFPGPHRCARAGLSDASNQCALAHTPSDRIALCDSQSQQTPYATNYVDEAARNLGIENGKWEAFSTHSSDPLMPRFKGGIEDGKAMVGLQWRFGS